MCPCRQLGRLIFLLHSMAFLDSSLIKLSAFLGLMPRWLPLYGARHEQLQTASGL